MDQSIHLVEAADDYSRRLDAILTRHLADRATAEAARQTYNSARKNLEQALAREMQSGSELRAFIARRGTI